MVVHYLPGGERIGQAPVERVAPGPGEGVEGVGAIGAGQRDRRLEVGLAGVDVVHGELTRRGRIADGGVGDAAVLEHGVVLGERNRDGRIVVAAGDGDIDVVGGGAVKRGDDQGGRAPPARR